MTRDEMIEKLERVQESCARRDEVAALASVIAALRAPAVTGALDMSFDQMKAFADAIDNPPDPNDALRELMTPPPVTGAPPCPSCVSEFGKLDPACATCHGSGRCPSAGAPPDLVALVQEWQAARKPTVLATPGEFLAETFQAAVRRMSAADEALAACRLDVAEAETPAAGKRVQTPNEAEILRALSDALTGGNASTWEQVLHAAEQHRSESGASVAPEGPIEEATGGR